ncbi:MAG: DUF5107 domain-containing protein [Phycisphaerae bacterium]
MKNKIIAKMEPLVIPTYGLGEPLKYPIFLEKRVYQGSCGKVYPLPFIDKVLQDRAPEDVSYLCASLENEYLRLEMLPEIGGRIFTGQDKTNGYDFFYRQDVIKPALVGLAGPWISGGVEFNWPQHHRPGTYMPADVYLTEDEDGASTVWMSEHDPLNRLKGMHGVRIRPGSCLIQLEARLYNRTPLTHTFLWWANVAAKVHDNYESFFPPDVRYVADHAVRAMSSFPKALGDYYGVDYGNRAGANDLTRYKNIPVPTSYMVCQTDFNFFGGYDHDAGGGFVHVANKYISPGKKQWTWGNHEFGWAWDRELTDKNGPYIELMAGVYTDNQPDFSYLLPYETKTFSQYWWPYSKIGPVQNATELLAVRFVVEQGGRIDAGLASSEPLASLTVVIRKGSETILRKLIDIAPDSPWQDRSLKFTGTNETNLSIEVYDEDEELLIAFRPVDTNCLTQTRELATEPPMPEDIESQDELYLTGEHLDLYRHPTRYPEIYWQEALSRDPGDCRCNIALGRQALGRGEFEKAALRLETAVKRLTFRHPNPETGQAHYYLALAKLYMDLPDEAYALFYKATWNYEWRGAAYYQLACLDCAKRDFGKAFKHISLALETNENNKAVVLRAIILRLADMKGEAVEVLEELLEIDPLDHFARFEMAQCIGEFDEFFRLTRNDAQTAIDIVSDYAEAGFFEDAILLLEMHAKRGQAPCAVPNPLSKTVMTDYILAKLYAETQNPQALAALEKARAGSQDYFFPSRLFEQKVLEWAISREGEDPCAAYGLGNLCYDKKRHEDAIAYWEAARAAAPNSASLHRNLAIAYWNVRRDKKAARESYEAALKCSPDDALLISEFDQLCKKIGVSAAKRLEFLQANIEQVLSRDDSACELCALLNQLGRPQEALELLLGRRFHPWEGGEGRVLRQYTLSRILLGKLALENSRPSDAIEQFDLAMDTPDNLGEKYHLLQAKADVNFWRGKALRILGREQEANEAFLQAAQESGDFQDMAVTAFSELSYYKGLSLIELGRKGEAARLFASMRSWALEQSRIPAKVDYFATSLPNMLVFEDDIDAAKNARMSRLVELAEAGVRKCGV